MDYVGADLRAWARDWRAWVLAGAVVSFTLLDAGGALDGLLDDEALERLFYDLAIAVSVALGRPTLTLLLGVLATAGTAVSLLDEGGRYNVALVGSLAVTSIVFTALAYFVGASRASAERRAALVGREGILRRTFSGNRLPMFVVDPDTDCVIEANPAAASFYGLADGTLQTLTVMDLVDADPEAVSGWLRAAARGDAPPFEVTSRLADGSDRVVELVASAAEDGGRPLIVATFRDVTAAAADRMRLAESRALLADTLNTEPDFHTVLEPVRDGAGRVVDLRYVEANSIACRALGMNRDLLIGRLITEVIPAFAGSTRLAAFCRVVETGEPIHLEEVPALENVDLRGMGAWLDITVYPAGAHLSVVIHDASSRVEASQELARSRADYRILSDMSADVVFRSVEGNITYVSPAVTRMLGWSPHELLGGQASLEVHPEDHAEVARARAEPSPDGQVIYTARLRRRDGTYVACEVRTRSVDGSSSLHDVVGSIRDVTQRLADLRSRERSLEDLRAIMHAHPDAWVISRPIYDSDGSVIDFAHEDANDKALAWYGKTLPEFLSETSLSLRGPLGTEAIKAAVPATTGQFVALDDVPSTTRTRGGEQPVWVDVRVAALPGERILFSWRDATDRHEAAETQQHLTEILVAAEARSNALVQSAPAGTAYVRLDRTFERVNPALARMTGRDQQWLLQHSVDDIIAPEDLPLDRSMRDDILTGRAHAVTERKRILHADGHTITTLHSIASVPGPDGTPTGYVSQFIDITDELMALDALIESERRYRLLSDNSTDWAFTANEFGEITYSSGGHSKATGLAVADVVGKSILDLVHPDDFMSTLTWIGQVVTSSPASVQVRHAASGEGWLWVEMTGSTSKAADSAATIVCGVRDIQAEREYLQTLSDSERQFRLLAEQSNDVVVVLDGTTITWVSPSLTRVVGWEPSSWIGRAWAQFLHPDDRTEAGRFAALSRLGENVVERHRLRDAQGQYHWVEWHGGPYKDPEADIEGIVVAFRVVDDKVAAEDQLARRALTDDLTGLATRSVAFDRLDELAKQHRRSRDRSAIFFIDLDHFKQINDTLGHSTGDVVLVNVAARLQTVLREGDLVARMGGDEFLAIAPGVSSDELAQEMATKILNEIKSPVDTPHGPVIPSASVGVTIAASGEYPDDLVARADAAMYQAKQGGRDRVVVIPALHG